MSDLCRLVHWLVMRKLGGAPQDDAPKGGSSCLNDVVSLCFEPLANRLTPGHWN